MLVKMDFCSCFVSSSDRDVILICCGAEKAKHESEDVELTVSICSYPHLWLQACGFKHQKSVFF